jgi:hypothetical protein
MKDAELVLKRLLDVLEAKIDLAHVARIRERNRAAIYYEPVDRPPLVCYLPYEGGDFRPYSYTEAFDDPAKMMVNQLLAGWGSPYAHITAPLYDDMPYTLRSDTGIVIVASMFGAAITILDDNMPWATPFESLDGLRALVDAPLPDIQAGIGRRVLEVYDFYHHVLAGYPTCREAFEVALPSILCPFNVAELLWPNIYLDIFEHADLINRVLGHITEQILRAYDAFKGLARDTLMPEGGYQHGAATRGHMLVRADSIINVSPDMYRELVLPHHARISEALGGVGFHACGKVDNHIDALLDVPQVQCIDLGQPEMNDLDTVYAKCAPRKVTLPRLQVPKESLTAPQVMGRFPRGVNLIYHAESVADGRATFAHYANTA